MQSDKPTNYFFLGYLVLLLVYRELDAVHDVYEELARKNRRYFICCLCRRCPFYKLKQLLLVKRKGWNYEVVYDPNHDLKRILNVVNIPNLFVYHKGNVIYKHSGYSPGSEDVLYNKIKDALKK
jgi:hypothetical protein